MTDTIQRDELLTPAELRAMDLTAELANQLAAITGERSTRGSDVAELVHHIHVIQHAVMAQAAARAYPDRFRPLGGRVESETP